MTHAPAELIIAEQGDPVLRLRDTGGRLEWFALFKRFWEEFKIEGSNGRYGGADGSTQRADPENVSPTATEDKVFEFVVQPPRRVSLEVLPAVSFYPLQEWEGHVIEVGDKTFKARLIDITAGERHDREEVELPIDDLTDDDREILAPGRVFRWAIGYQRSRAGSKKRVSQIVFRRLPQWTERELAEAKEEGRQLSAAIKWE